MLKKEEESQKTTKTKLEDLKQQLAFNDDEADSIESALPSLLPQSEIIIVETDNIELTHKQIRFVDEYMIDLNGHKAALRAGYSEVSAKQQAHRLLINPNIKKELIIRQNQDIINNGIKRSHTYKMILDSLYDINIRLTQDFEGEYIQLVTLRLKHIDLLNKMGGFYQDNIVNIQNNQEINEIKIIINNGNTSN